MKGNNIKKAIRKGYSRIARQTAGCACTKTCCDDTNTAQATCKEIGYTEEDLKKVPQGANLGLGCGNPTALANLKQGETVLDLGAGAGFDCFLAADKVGKDGKVIGVDMTPEMIDKARENAQKGNYGNVEFRLGEIENLPAADSSVDVIISNCVINLSDDKKRVFKEAFRVLKPGGKMMVSDIVLLKELPDFIKNSISAYVGCLSGALLKNDYINIIKEVGFNEVEITKETLFPIDCMLNDSTIQAIIKDSKIPHEKVKETANSVISVSVYGVKPAETT